MFEISINKSNFLWMTRGKKWGFRFLSKCSLLAPVSETVYKAVFLHDDSRFGYWKGFVFLDGRRQPYVACRCYDSMIQRDEAGRRIPHDFLLLCSDEEFKCLSGLAWESLILEQVRGLYSDRYLCCANEVTDCLIDFKVRLSSEIQPSTSCATLNVPVSQSDRDTPSPQRRFTGSYWFPILLVCLGIGYVSVHHSGKPDLGIHAEDSAMPENGKERDAVYVAPIGDDKPSADSFNPPNLDSVKSVVLDGEGAEEETSRSGGMGGNSSVSESQPELAHVPSHEHLDNTMQEVPTEPPSKPSDTDALRGADL